MHLQESGEMYLETIYVLLKEKSCVRAIDIAEYMGFSKPSVSRALSILKNGGLVVADKAGYLSLTEAGFAAAERTYARHKLISAFLMKIGVSEEQASEDACKMEHVISDESFEALRKYLGCDEE